MAVAKITTGLVAKYKYALTFRYYLANNL